jgi:hypothetical protein
MLPWFGFFEPGGGPVPEFSAVSRSLSGPPYGSADLLPGTRHWGLLIVSWSCLVAGLAVVAMVACVAKRYEIRVLIRLLLRVTFAAFVLVALVVPEFFVKIPYGDDPPLGIDGGAFVGLGLAVVSTSSAAFAWASKRYPRLCDPSIPSQLDLV